MEGIVEAGTRECLTYSGEGKGWVRFRLLTTLMLTLFFATTFSTAQRYNVRFAKRIES